jgi:predicted Fe-Mo cluster-binding NifX family protein
MAHNLLFRKLKFLISERRIMKVAITSQGSSVNDQVDPRFGRAKFFIVMDTESENVEVADNAQNLNAAQGAGIQAGQNVAALGVQAVITGHVGPKAFSVLNSAGIKIYTGATGTVKEALEKLKAGELSSADDADVEGHWV